MPHTCPRCRRTNPADALFCYWDGGPLGTGPVLSGPGRNRFPMPFVLPSGRACHTFDELALACYDDWDGAQALVRHGVLASFLAGLGRADLSLAARGAAQAGDLDVALDSLLSRFPCQSRVPPRLQAEPAQVSLGTLPIGQGARFDLRLANRGLGLIRGKIVCEGGAWLALGAPAGPVEKVFQFLHDTTVPVFVRPRELRAGPKPLEARLAVSSSGGDAVVAVSVTVPAVPFPEGALAGALTPRQLAGKAKAAPREAARLFENGAVVRWYRANGWSYPVEGPPAAGLAAIQQFFEALGLTRPPKVTLSESALFLAGAPGETVRRSLEVLGQERRPVYAHVLSDQPWLSVDRVEPRGQSVTIHLVVRSVPALPGRTCEARLTVTANGRQRFVVPVTLAVRAAPVAVPVASAAPAPREAPPTHRMPVQFVPPMPAQLEAVPLEEMVPVIEGVAEPAPLPEPPPAAEPSQPLRGSHRAPPPLRHPHRRRQGDEDQARGSR